MIPTDPFPTFFIQWASYFVTQQFLGVKGCVNANCCNRDIIPESFLFASPSTLGELVEQDWWHLHLKSILLGAFGPPRFLPIEHILRMP